MEKDAILFFKGKCIKLTFHNGFNLVGTILETYEETVLFETSQKTSAIANSDIKTIVEA